MKHLLAILAFGFIALSTSAQYRSSVISTFSSPGGPGTSGGGNIGFTVDVNSPSVPFDGGLSLLLLASGVGYVAKKKEATIKVIN